MSPTSYLTAPPRGGRTRIALGSGPSKARKLDRGAAIHDHAQAGGTGARCGSVVDHAELHPHRLGPDRDRLVDVFAHRRGASEQVDDLDSLVRRERVEAALSEQLVAGL